MMQKKKNDKELDVAADASADLSDRKPLHHKRYFYLGTSASGCNAEHIILDEAKTFTVKVTPRHMLHKVDGQSKHESELSTGA